MGLLLHLFLALLALRNISWGLDASGGADLTYNIVNTTGSANALIYDVNGNAVDPAAVVALDNNTVMTTEPPPNIPATGKVTEYYELLDQGAANCQGRTDGTYPLRNVRTYLICRNKQKLLVMSCGYGLVYDVETQYCLPPTNIVKEYFCRFRGDGIWDSPWNTRMIIECTKGITSAARCKGNLRYDSAYKDCIQENLLIRCFTLDRDFMNAKVGCYRKANMKMDLIISDLDGNSKDQMLNWNRFVESVESLVCRCSKKAYEEGYAFFAIRLWAECWAGKNRTELNALMDDPSQKSEQYCYSNITKTAFEKCNDNDTSICVGSEHGQYIYTLVNSTKADDVGTGITNTTLSRSLTSQGDSIDVITFPQLQTMASTGKVQLIDVRETYEYEGEGSIVNSLNIPLKDLSEALKLPDKEFEKKYGMSKPLKDDCNIVFLCSSGVRSDMAFKIAKDNGYKCPKSLKGGYDLLPKVKVKS